MKKILIVAAIAMALAFYLGNQFRRANDLHQYALANNCEWVWQGTAYGDNRDYICK